MYISVNIDCANVANGDPFMSVNINPYNYADGQLFKGTIHVRNNFDDSNAFDDSCLVEPGLRTVTHSSSSTGGGDCSNEAVSILKKSWVVFKLRSVKYCYATIFFCIFC